LTHVGTRVVTTTCRYCCETMDIDVTTCVGLLRRHRAYEAPKHWCPCGTNAIAAVLIVDTYALSELDFFNSYLQRSHKMGHIS